MKAMRNDDFNTILELKMRGYQPSENTLKSLQPDISSTTFIAAVKIFQMEGVLTYIIHSGFISGYQNRYGDNLKPPTNVYHRMTA